MFCKNCGSQISDDATFCKNCGQSVTHIKKKPIGIDNIKKVIPIVLIVVIIFGIFLIKKNTKAKDYFYYYINVTEDDIAVHLTNKEMPGKKTYKYNNLDLSIDMGDSIDEYYVVDNKSKKKFNMNDLSDEEFTFFFKQISTDLRAEYGHEFVWEHKHLNIIIDDEICLTSTSFLFAEPNFNVTFYNLEKLNMSFNHNMTGMFMFCNDLTTLDVPKWNTSKVSNMAQMFFGCDSLITLDVSKWDTSKVSNMSTMFGDCGNLTSLDVSKWNTSKVSNMVGMFGGCNSLTSLDVSKWNTSKVSNMAVMFTDCSSLTTLDVSKWNTSKVSNMRRMFFGCKSLISLDVSKWNIKNVKDMYDMFAGGCQSVIIPYWYN